MIVLDASRLAEAPAKRAFVLSYFLLEWSRMPRYRDARTNGEVSLQREIVGILSAATAVSLLLSLFGFAGTVGSQLATTLLASLGVFQWLVPLFFLLFALQAWFPRRRPSLGRVVGFVILLFGLLLLVGLGASPERAGSFSLALLGKILDAFGRPVSWVVAFAISFIGGSLLIRIPIFVLVLERLWWAMKFSYGEFKGMLVFFSRLLNVGGRKGEQLLGNPEEETSDASRSFSEHTLPAEHFSVSAPHGAILPRKKRLHTPSPTFPPDLLDSVKVEARAGDIAAVQRSIANTFENFGIGVEMADVSVGPTVTQYTLKPATGVKVSQIMALQNDLALALAAHPIRIEAPIPGRALVGIEVPNQTKALVGLRELLLSPAFREGIRKNSGSLVLALGKDVAGAPYIARLDQMPHLLIAGATGSGKTVAINSVLTALLSQKQPHELKLLLIDPKRVELPAYNGIPHLIAPVVTEVKKTIAALKWILREMDRRFQVLAASGRRDIASYNEHATDELPYLVVVIDELADLMVAAASDVEASIIRIAQMARAVGIHLIVATQRPSVDVLTGLIKANITTRLAFAVASSVDSRTILDVAGAEKLLGRGDCLLICAELSKPKRLQGAYVSEAETGRIVRALRELGEPEYEEVVSPDGGQSGAETSVFASVPDEDEPLLEEAIAVIRQAGRASASLLQRRLKVGYARAARMLDIMEERGVVGPGEGAKPREVLMERAGNDMLEQESDTPTVDNDDEGDPP